MLLTDFPQAIYTKAIVVMITDTGQDFRCQGYFKALTMQDVVTSAIKYPATTGTILKHPSIFESSRNQLEKDVLLQV